MCLGKNEGSQDIQGGGAVTSYEKTVRAEGDNEWRLHYIKDARPGISGVEGEIEAESCQIRGILCGIVKKSEAAYRKPSRFRQQ